MIECKQYPRHEKIVISGIPDNVAHADLKDEAVFIFNEIGLEIKEYDFSACHRLPKKQNSMRTPSFVSTTTTMWNISLPIETK